MSIFLFFKDVSLKLVGPILRWLKRNYINLRVISILNPDKDFSYHRIRFQICVLEKTMINDLKWVVQGKECEFKVEAAMKPSSLPCAIERGNPLNVFCRIDEIMSNIKASRLDLSSLAGNELKIRIDTEDGKKDLNFDDEKIISIIKNKVRAE